MNKSFSNSDAVKWLLRIGLAAVFLYAAISSLQHPLVWAGFLPNFLTRSVDGITLIKLFAVYELALTAWILSGKYPKVSSLLAALTLIGIVVTDPSQLITTFRDIGLTCMALALYFTDK